MKTRIVKISKGYVPQIWHWWHGWCGVSSSLILYYDITSQRLCCATTEENALVTLERYARDKIDFLADKEKLV